MVKHVVQYGKNVVNSQNGSKKYFMKIHEVMKSASREDDFELKMDLLRKRQILTKNN